MKRPTSTDLCVEDLRVKTLSAVAKDVRIEARLKECRFLVAVA